MAPRQKVANEWDSDSDGTYESSSSTDQAPHRRDGQAQSRKLVAQPITPGENEREDDNFRRNEEERLKNEVAAYTPYRYRQLTSWRSLELEDELQVLKAYCAHWDETDTPIFPLVDPQIIQRNIYDLQEAHQQVWRQSQDRQWCEKRRRLFKQLRNQMYELDELISPDRMFDCAVCGEQKWRRDFPLYVTNQCQHSVTCCRECMEQWTTSQLDNQGWNRIKCPGSGCNINLERADVQYCSSPDTYARYNAFRRRAKQSSDPNWTWCLNPRCNEGQVHSGRSPKMTCKSCGFRTCAFHRLPWHRGRTCQQYDWQNSTRRRQQEEASEDWKETQVKMCTHCSAPIHKIGGCSFMFCAHCQRSFDWSQAQPYVKQDINDELPYGAGTGGTGGSRNSVVAKILITAVIHLVVRRALRSSMSNK